MTRTRNFLLILGTLAILIVGAVGALQAVIEGQFGLGLAFLCVGFIAFAMMCFFLVSAALAARNRSALQRAPESTEPATHGMQWTPTHITRIVEALAAASESLRGPRESRRPAVTPTLNPAAQWSDGTTGPRVQSTPSLPAPLVTSELSRRPHLPSCYKVLDVEFAEIQRRHKIPEDRARRMREEVFGAAGRRPNLVEFPSYLGNADAKVIELRIAFARKIRPHLTNMPMRGAGFCRATAELLAEAMGRQDSRLAELQLKRMLLVDFSVDELAAWCLYNWRFSPSRISAWLDINVLSVELAIRDVDETLQQIEELTSKLLEQSNANDGANLPQMYLDVCTSWLRGPLVASQ